MPDGTGTGRLPIRDMMPIPSSEHREENFAAHIRVARAMGGHNSLWRGQHRNSKTVVHARQALQRSANSAPRLRHPLDFANDRGTVEMLEFDLKLAAAGRMLDAGVTTNVAFGL